ncbi:MAG: PIN domain-containing protein [Planctomycetota bacterium]
MIFVDTCAIIARHLEGDQYHAIAFPLWQELVEGNHRLITSNLVVNETMNYMIKRAGSSFAVNVGRSLYASRRLSIVRTAGDDETRALHLLNQKGEPGYSFTDCVSMVLMGKHDIGEVFTFDDHFRQAGYKVVPETR